MSFRGLNRVTNLFKFLTGQCDAAIKDIGDGSGDLHFISLDNMQGYHEICVHDCDVEKLVIFFPDRHTYAYLIVLPFGLHNEPPFYTMVIRVMKDEAMLLFRLFCNQEAVNFHSDTSDQAPFIMLQLPRTQDYDRSCCDAVLPNVEWDPRYVFTCTPNLLFSPRITIVDCDGGDMTVCLCMKGSDEVHITGMRIIIDNLKLSSTSKGLLMLLLKYFLCVYVKYRVTLKVGKCDFF